MKRKQPSSDAPAPQADTSIVDTESTFTALDLDARLQQAIAKLGFSHPTLVQAKAIPLALEGKDILARAKTGSGKTAAYLLPILQSILKAKDVDATTKVTRALILVPTKELAEQVTKMTDRLIEFCRKQVKVVNLAQNVGDAVQRSLLAEGPDVVVATPARVVSHKDSGWLGGVEKLVIDEADLVLSYGYEDDLKGIAGLIGGGKSVQSWLMSATMSKEIDGLKATFCRNPVVLRLEEDESEAEGSVEQFVVRCAEEEKFLLTYVIFKLKLIKGKCIIFVNDIDRCYRLKLFLEQFGIRSCVLNSELPVNSRLHIVDEFNKNVYEIIIASDENEVLGAREDEDSDNEAPAKQENNAEEDAEKSQSKKKKKKKPARVDKEYGVSRGLDFQHVSFILNFDLPTTSKSYTHRIGRTGRAHSRGLAMSFVIPRDLHGKHRPTSIPSTEHDEKILARITKHQTKLGRVIKPYVFDMTQVAAFRYRMNDALRAVTSTAVREARTRELRQELLKSEKLKRHFEENPEDLRYLRHDGEVRTARVQPHLKHVPEYLLPKTGKQGLVAEGKSGGDDKVLKRRLGTNRIRKARERKKGGAKKSGGRDPLKVFGRK